MSGVFDYWGVLGTGVQSFFAWATFNRDAFADNVAYRQNQKYQQKNYHISWIAIARDDIRDMMGISVNRINNYMIVATLILGIAASTIVSVNFNQNCPDFIVYAFYINIGLSLVFLSLAIMFGVKGQNCAFTNTMKLLTYQVRPENPAEYSHDYMRQAQWIERLGLTQLLRIPGTLPNYDHELWGSDVAPAGAGGGKAGAITGAASSGAAPATNAKLLGKPQLHGVSDEAKGLPKEKGYPNVNLEDATPLETLVKRSNHTWYLTKFARFMGLWQPYDSYSKHAMGFGIIGLGQGSSYFAMGTIISSGRYIDEYGALLISAAFIYVVAIVIAQNFTAHSDHANYFLALGALVLGPFLSSIVVTSQNAVVEQVLAPLSLLAHTCFWGGALWHSNHVVEDKKLDLLNDGSALWRTQPGREAVQSEAAHTVGARAPALHRGSAGGAQRHAHGRNNRRWQQQRRADHLDDVSIAAAHRTRLGPGAALGLGGASSSASREHYDVESGGIRSGVGSMTADLWPTDFDEFEERQAETVAKITRTMRLTLLMSAMLWLGFFIWGTVKYWWAPLGRTFPDELELDSASYSWPGPLFRPHALACTQGKVFAADKFRVWDLSNSPAAPVGCDLKWPIIDASVTCSTTRGTETCRTFVLIQPLPPLGETTNRAPPQVVECETGLSRDLLQGTSAARHITAHERDGEVHLIVDHDGELAEYAWSDSEGGAWVPQWYVGRVEQTTPLQGVHVMGRSRVLLFHDAPHRKVAVQSLDLDSLSLQKEWTLPDSTDPLTTGCAMEDGTAILLTGKTDSISENSGPHLFRTRL